MAVIKLFASCDGRTLDSVLNSIDEAVCVHDKDMVFLGANAAFSRFYGLENPEDLIGKSGFDVYPNFRQSVFYQSCENTISTGQQTSRIGYSANLKTWIVFRCYLIDEGLVVSVVHRLTDDLSKSGYVQHYDSLTSLPNRWAFETDFRVLSGYQQMLSVALIDISHFRKFNEATGFHAGDRVLMEAGSIIKGCTVSPDKAYRIGNDQFLLMTINGEEHLDQLIESTLKALEAPFSINDHDYAFRYNVGVHNSKSAENVASILKKVEAALTNAKIRRPSIARYLPLMDTVNYDPSLIKEIRDAIQNNELCLYFQPQIDLLDEKVAGAEALVRWRHPTRGLVPPFSFLPFAEETGIIQEIDREIVKKAFLALAYFRTIGLAVPLSVNLSAQSVCNPNTVELFAQQMAEHGIDPDMICLEITETSLICDPVASQQVTQAIRDMGIDISIDDFGSGYSSMSYLLRYPSQFLKIDYAFIKNLTKSENHRIMVKNMINLAHGLGIGVVAEGVESIEERDLLRSYGCDLVQGFYYSPPLPLNEFLEWTKKQGISSFKSTIS
jgi:diguanylate cyclase (GGDEF)-like protein